MVKSDRQDVRINCFGYARGCLVSSCNLGADCYKKTLIREEMCHINNIKPSINPLGE